MQVIGRIYKITSSETDYVYVGSTTQQLNKRFASHKSNYKNYYLNKYRYVTSFEVCKYTNAKIELIHEGLFDSKKDMDKLEGDIIRTTPNAVNKCIPGLTHQESCKKYNEQHKEAKQEYNAKRYEQNKEAISARRKLYRYQKKKEATINDATNPENDI